MIFSRGHEVRIVENPGEVELYSQKGNHLSKVTLHINRREKGRDDNDELRKRCLFNARSKLISEINKHAPKGATVAVIEDNNEEFLENRKQRNFVIEALKHPGGEVGVYYGDTRLQLTITVAYY